MRRCPSQSPPKLLGLHRTGSFGELGERPLALSFLPLAHPALRSAWTEGRSTCPRWSVSQITGPRGAQRAATRAARAGWVNQGAGVSGGMLGEMPGTPPTGNRKSSDVFPKQPPLPCKKELNGHMGRSVCSGCLRFRVVLRSTAESRSAWKAPLARG